jgi:hypothetical protein
MKTIALSLANHHEPALWPADLRIREYPTIAACHCGSEVGGRRASSRR